MVDERLGDITEEYEVENSIDGILYGRRECAESLQNMIKQWRSEVDIRMIK